MCINFDVVIETGDEYSVDMKTGLDTFQGISESTRYIAEALLTEHVPKRMHHTRKVRTEMKKSFRGSYGLNFSLNITDPEIIKRFKKIGKGSFSELVSYFINEALYIESLPLSPKSTKILEDLGDIENQLILQLRRSSLELVHEVSTKFGHDVKLRYKKNSTEQLVLAKFDKTTVYSLKPKADKTNIEINASITRLNIKTGNGRLLLVGASDTVSFGFGNLYKDIKTELKEKLSDNLSYNNVRSNSDDWKSLKFRVKAMKLRDGKIVKYIINGFYND
ncbi:hypothetical protein BCV33_11995 [Vibrio lentus]|uniref:hypothetical protein n=1 Tax=Vibrio lentus TaxID=136468 RepID=UPI000C8325E4|nr:hypothetical protein [Vibrio lentus]PME57464.1 hypothetical protein BCV33_11995 [Vibrio lentus]